MERNEDLRLSDQGEDTTQKGELIAKFLWLGLIDYNLGEL